MRLHRLPHPLRGAAALVLALACVCTWSPALAAGPAVGPRPQVLLIHGGSWYRVGHVVVDRMAANRARLRAWGYVTHLVRYRPRRQAFPGVLATYDRLRRRVGPRTPICLYGSSAGAQMALMLAVRRPDVACVVSLAAPTDLTELPAGLRRRARAAFGERLQRWSPASYRLFVPTLLEQATDDPVVPFWQMGAMHAGAPRSRALALAPGAAPWIHAPVDRGQLARIHATERRFMRAAVALWRSAGPFPRARRR